MKMETLQISKDTAEKTSKSPLQEAEEVSGHEPPLAPDTANPCGDVTGRRERLRKKVGIANEGGVLLTYTEPYVCELPRD